jgi:dihydroflavonol-4-reductase
MATKVLLTGASGFLGRNIAASLTRAGCDVLGLARGPSRLSELGKIGVNVLPGTVLDEDLVSAACRDVDAVIHCAGAVSMRTRDAALVKRTNVEGTRHVLSAARARGLRVVHASTTATIGWTREPVVLDEESREASHGASSAYVESKLEAEGLALAAAEAGDDVVVLNPGIVLGPGDIDGTSTQLVGAYLRGQLRHHLAGGGSFCDVRDAAEAFRSALDFGRAGERYIIAGHNRAYADVQEELHRLTGLHRSVAVPAMFAEAVAALADAGAAFWQHPYEDFNPATVRWGSGYNFCSSRKAELELRYRARPFTETLLDTIASATARG